MFKTKPEIKNILWDFDGVLMDSMAIRDKGFEIVLADYPRQEVEILMKFHRRNGGLSRYVKFRHFFEEIRKEQISEKKIENYAKKFSKVMLENLINPRLLIEDSLRFVAENQGRYRMHIVSGSDEQELRHICAALGIENFFHSIYGSPTPKKELVRNLLKEFNYKPGETILIGDSINDLEASVENGISFYGYNNSDLNKENREYIEKFG